MLCRSLQKIGGAVGEENHMISHTAICKHNAKPNRRRYKLADLMAEMPQGFPLAEGWEEMPAVLLELGLADICSISPVKVTQ